MKALRRGSRGQVGRIGGDFDKETARAANIPVNFRAAAGVSEGNARVDGASSMTYKSCWTGWMGGEGRPKRQSAVAPPALTTTELGRDRIKDERTYERTNPTVRTKMNVPLTFHCKDVSMSTPLPTKRWKRSPAEAASAVLRPDEATQEFVPARTNPSEHIAAVLRRVTMRTHDALKARRVNHQALLELRDEVVELEGELERLELRGLRPFLRTLRGRIDDSLGL